MPTPHDPKTHAHPLTHHADADVRRRPVRGGYVELTVTSNFTFLTGASHPDEYAAQAARLGHAAVAITDVNTVGGVARAYTAAQEIGLPFVVGSRLAFVDQTWFTLCVYPTTLAAYGRLCQLLTTGKRRAPKGACELRVEDALANHDGLLAVIVPHGACPDDAETQIAALKDVFDDDRLSLAITRLREHDDRERLAERTALAQRTKTPLVAVNDAHYHIPQRRFLQDVLTCIRHGCTLSQAGFRLFSNSERYLKSTDEMQRLFCDRPAAVARTVEIARRAAEFSLSELRYEYPDEICPAGRSVLEHLRDLTQHGLQRRYPAGAPPKVVRQIEHELALIADLRYEPYFLTVYDLVEFARSRGILCQGRGAAANSAVCYCLGITVVDPDRTDVLFERFVSRERNEPPDIDVDFEHERREEVIQYIYEKYGRKRAGLTAVTITYRRRSALRDVGKALGLSLDAVDRLAKRLRFGDSDSDASPEQVMAASLRKLGFDPHDATLRLLLKLVDEILGFPRHRSQHVGGFVITRRPLCELVPIENAAMPDRTVIEWDKDDIDAMGMLKVDVLGLGMLTCIRKAFDLLERSGQARLTLANVPAEDPAVYEMIQRADTLGVFQVESRAQMNMLSRLKPKCFYDLVIEVAIVRPGPIQGGMVHPYLRRREGLERVDYPSEAVRGVLEKTLGVPLFQEQVMQLAMIAAGFTPGQADQLRRAMGAWRRNNSIRAFYKQLVGGMLANGYTRDFAERVFKQILGFGEYGFPESHAASFAVLVYISAYLKRHYPAAFAAALINSQPMGFYAPAQIVRDARDHGVAVHPIDVNHSAWDCTLEDDGRALRLGMRLAKGLRERDADVIGAATREHGPFATLESLWRVSGAPAAALHALTQADAFQSMKLDRRQALWRVRALADRPEPLIDAGAASDVAAPLPRATAYQEMEHDYARTGLSLKSHPMAFLRRALRDAGVRTAAEVRDVDRTPHNCNTAVAGVVLFRQQPSTAKGVMFMTLEDETGRIDLVLQPRVLKTLYDIAAHSGAVLARGRVERQGITVNVLVRELEDLSSRLSALPLRSRDFR